MADQDISDRPPGGKAGIPSDHSELQRSLYRVRDAEAPIHLFRVVSKRLDRYPAVSGGPFLAFAIIEGMEIRRERTELRRRNREAVLHHRTLAATNGGKGVMNTTGAHFEVHVSAAAEWWV